MENINVGMVINGKTVIRVTRSSGACMVIYSDGSGDIYMPRLPEGRPAERW